MQKITKNDITGVILAGGQARRMKGQDKGLILFNGKPLIEYVIEVFNPQVSKLIINANRNHDKYSQYGFEIISDETETFTIASRLDLIILSPLFISRAPVITFLTFFIIFHFLFITSFLKLSSIVLKSSR